MTGAAKLIAAGSKKHVRKEVISTKSTKEGT